LRNRSIPIVEKISMKPNNNFINKKITKLLKSTKEFSRATGIFYSLEQAKTTLLLL